MHTNPATHSNAQTADPVSDLTARRFLALAIALAQLSNIANVPIQIVALGFAALTLCLVLPRPPRKLLWRGALLLLTLVALLLVYRHFNRLIGRDPGIALLFIMGPLKLIEARNTRDFMVIWTMGLILFVASFFEKLGLLAALTVPLVIVVYVATLRVLDPQTSSPQTQSWFTHLRAATAHTLLGLPLAALLFVLFPRAAAPLWGMRNAETGTTGLSEEMRPGQISALIRSDEIAFRVEFDNRIPPNQALYWRGPVLREFDGLSWRVADIGRHLKSSNQFTEFRAADIIRNGINYTVTAEKLDTRWLPILELPSRQPTGPTIERSLFVTDAQQIGVQQIANGPTQYRAQSVLRDHYATPVSEIHRNELYTGADNWNPRTRAFAEALATQHRDPQARIHALLTYFNQQHFFYTLNPPLYGTKNDVQHLTGIDEFLFDGKRGFCEHYAGAAAFLLRVSGIPTRVITGYQGGEIQPGGYMIVRQSDAHAWIEAWVDGHWQRIDPTAAVAPNRIERNLREALPETERLLIGTNGWASSLSAFSRLSYWWDGANFAYTKWVIGFDRDRQREFLDKFGLSGMNIVSAFGWMLLAIVASGGLMILVWWLRRQYMNRHNDPAVMAWHALRNRLQWAGLAITPSETVSAVLARAIVYWPHYKAQFDAFARHYNQQRFSTKHDSSRLQAVIAALPKRSQLSKIKPD